MTKSTDSGRILSILLALVIIILSPLQGAVAIAAQSDAESSAYKHLTKSYKMVKEAAAIEELGFEFGSQGKTYKSDDKAVEELADYIEMEPTDVWEAYQVIQEADEEEIATTELLKYLGSYPQLGAGLSLLAWFDENGDGINAEMEKADKCIEKIKDENKYNQYIKYRKKISNYFDYIATAFDNDNLTAVKFKKKVRSYENSISKLQKKLK